MQTILGSGGAIGTDLAKELTKYTDKIRLVSRNPKKVNESDELFSCDLRVKESVKEAVKGSEVAYLTAGFEYNTSTWQKTWPLVMQNVIDACKEFDAKLVFLDNIYMYDPNKLSFMDEETPMNPSSKKGKVREQLVNMLFEEVNKGKLQALIARSADFYGPGIKNSVLLETVYKNFLNGKKANWLCSLNYKHSFTFTPDAAKATAILGNDPKAFNQIWHLPTAPNPMTGKEWINAFAKEMNVEPKVQVATKFIVKIMGLFMPVMKESYEMLYQYDRDYVFDSRKFDKAYGFEPTSYENGIKMVVNEGS
ncbi:MAG: NAD-dependent epimerase/dehydratase family protein [Bacteroidales bacterium]